MKLVIIFSAVISLALGEAPYAPSGWKPSGALLVLPSQQGFSRLESQQARQQQLPSSYGPPQQPSNTDQVGVNDGNNGVATGEQTPGQTGDYYVLLPNGKLQRIQYSASPLNAQEGNSRETQTPQAQNQNTFSQNQFGQQQFQQSHQQFQPNQQQFQSNQQQFQSNQQQFQPNQQQQFQQQFPQNQQHFQPPQQQFQPNYASNQQFSSKQATGQFNFERQNTFNQQSYQNEKFSQGQENTGFGQATNNVNSFQKFNGNEQTSKQNTFQSQQNAFRTSASEKSQSDAGQKSENADNGKESDESKTAIPKLVAQFSEAQLKANGGFPDGYVASVQFSEVPPITAPVYVFNPAPLVRVLRMAP